MSNQALSAVALSNVVALTDIHKTDGRIQSAAKFAGGIPLKVAAIAFATFESLIRATLLILAMPLKLISPKTFTNLTEKTFSAVHTILDATKAIVDIHAKQDPEKTTLATAPKTPKSYLNDSIDWAKLQLGKTVSTVQKNKVLTATVVGAAIVGIALYYSYPSLIKWFQGSAASNNPTPPTPPTPPPATPTGGTPLETCEVPNPFNSIFNPPTSKGLPNEAPSFPTQRETPLISDNLAAQLNNSFTTSLANHSGTATQIPTSTALPTINEDLFTPSLNSNITTCPVNNSGTATQIPTSTAPPATPNGGTPLETCDVAKQVWLPSLSAFLRQVATATPTGGTLLEKCKVAEQVWLESLLAFLRQVDKDV